MFNDHPIYRIDANSLRGSLLHRTWRDVRVVDGQLRDSFALSEAPASIDGTIICKHDAVQRDYERNGCRHFKPGKRLKS